MTHFTETTIQGNKYLHVIAYKDNFILGYNTLTQRAYYITESYSSDLMSEMPIEYQNWATPLIETLNYKAIIVNKDSQYYEILITL